MDHEPTPLLRERTTKDATSPGGVTVSVADIAVPLYVAVMRAEVATTTVAVSMMKTALREPAGTVTLAGTFTTVGLSLVSVTSAPLAGAALASVTVACG